MVSNNPQSDRYKYDGNKKVYVLIHGWNSDSNTWACGNDDNGGNFSSTIYQKDNNSLILCLDWRGAAITGFIDPNNLVQPDSAASWISYITDDAKLQLQNWGLTTDKMDNVTVIGHSLGTIMGATLSQKLGKAKTLIAMDPPGRLNNTFYKRSLSGDEFSTFQNTAQFVRAFVQHATLADNELLAITADEVVKINTTDVPWFIDKHGSTLKIVNGLLTGNKSFTSANISDSTSASNITNIPNGIFNFNDRSDHSDTAKRFDSLVGGSNTFDYYLQVKDSKPTDNIQFISMRNQDGTYTQYGTDQNNDEIKGQSDAANYIMYGGGGDDIFQNSNFGNSIISIKDFNSGESDKVSLDNTVLTPFDTKKPEYQIVDQNNQKQIQKRYCNYQRASNAFLGCGNFILQGGVTVEGGRVSEVSQTVLDDVMLSSTKTSNGVFIKR
jgi:pimeloyl-ACP methyl ester carboxylesterase